MDFDNLGAMLADLPLSSILAALICAMLVMAAAGLQALSHRLNEEPPQPQPLETPTVEADLLHVERVAIAHLAFTHGVCDARENRQRRPNPHPRGTRRYAVWAIEYAAGYEHLNPAAPSAWPKA